MDQQLEEALPPVLGDTPHTKHAAYARFFMSVLAVPALFGLLFLMGPPRVFSFLTAARLLAPHFGSSEFQFIFVNDLHYDPNYEPTGKPSSLCRSGDDKRSFAYGKYGCDTPVDLIGSFLGHAQTVAKPDFIIFGGDVPAHGAELSAKKIKEKWDDVMDMFHSAFPNVPVYSIIGNNDLAPDYGSVDTDPECFGKLTDAMTSLSEDEKETFRRGGYYFHDFGSTRVLFLNSVMYSRKRDKSDDRDPFGQFAWMEEKCAEATNKGMTIGVVMHIPPGIAKVGSKEGWYGKYREQYHAMAVKYNFKFTLSGHTHLDEMLPTSKDAVRYLLGAPALSPIRGNNPGFRVMTMGKDGIKNYKQYYLDILKETTTPKWDLEYEFTTAYGVCDVSPNSILKAVAYAKDDPEGRWRYRERVFSRAMQDGAFWYCVMITTTTDELEVCQNDLQKDIQQG